MSYSLDFNNAPVTGITINLDGKDITDRCAIDVLTGKIYIPAPLADASILAIHNERTRDMFNKHFEDMLKQVQKQIDLQQDWKPSLKRLQHKPEKKPSKLILALAKNVKTA